MSEDASRKTGRSFGRRVGFYTLTSVLLVAFGWLAGWWLIGHSFTAWAESNYFLNPFRIVFLFYLLIEAIVDFGFSPRWIRPMDEVPHEWLHWRRRMWETVLVVSVFSDCMGMFPVSFSSGARWAGIGLLATGLWLYAHASLDRRKFLRQSAGEDFPVKGVFGVIRSPETLSQLFTAFGTALVFNAWAGIFCALLTLGILAGYVIAQDTMMRQKYGNPWMAYSGRSKRWVPFLW